MLLLSKTIGAADAGSAGAAWEFESGDRRNLAVEFQFAYGAGGTLVDAYLQTSFDGGLTWGDIANFEASTAALTRRINLSSTTPVTTQNTPGDGTLAANTAVDGILGGQIRIKSKSTGTYTGATSLKIFAFGGRLRKVVT